jgi:hypothetical protein
VANDQDNSEDQEDVVKDAEHELEMVKAHRPLIEFLTARLHLHLTDNNFADRLMEQFKDSRK